MDYQVELFENFNDERGQLIVFLKESQLAPARKKFGQIYFVTFAKKGVVRGNHYHKKWREWFGVVIGRLQVVLEDVKTNERVNIVIDSKNKDYLRFEIGPYVAHSFRSLTDHAALLNYTNTEWAPEDTFEYKLI